MGRRQSTEAERRSAIRSGQSDSLAQEGHERAAERAGAFIEFVGGDCLPGRVSGLGSSSAIEEGVVLPFLIVEPSVPINWPDGPQRSRLRVLTRWLRRLVWDRRGGNQYEPATLFYKDGRQLAFRSLRFNSDGVSVLTDSDRREVRFTDLAELDMPRQDWWEAYFEQLAVLTPDCKSRLTRLETLEGLKVTTSADRFQPVPWADVNNPECWHHGVQPAWAVDPLWVRHARVLIRRFYSPHEVPLSLVEPSDTKLRSALAVGWRPNESKRPGRTAPLGRRRMGLGNRHARLHGNAFSVARLRALVSQSHGVGLRGGQGRLRERWCIAIKRKANRCFAAST